jgi:serine/threonine-protein kinase
MIAVLPFENLGDSSTAHIADATPDEIAARLGRLRQLGVISRASAIQYRNSDQPLTDIGRALGANYLLTGSLRRRQQSAGPDRVSLSTTLVRTADGARVWTAEYEKLLGELVDLQSDIPARVAAALNVRLGDADQRRLAASPTGSPEAYTFYLDAKRYGEGWVERDLRLAVALLEKAIRADSRFGLAYADLARAHLKLYWHDHDRTESRLARAKQAADRALAFGPDLAESHLAMGYYHYRGKLDYASALREFEIARQLQPSNSDLFLATGSVRRRQGNFADAAADFETAAQLDPRSVEKAEELGTTYFFLRRYEDAERAIDRAIKLGPDQYHLYGLKALLYLSWRGDRARAAAVLEDARQGISAQALVDHLLPFFGATIFRILDSELGPDYRLALDRMSPALFGADVSWYLITRAAWARHRGNATLARAHLDSARSMLETRVKSDTASARSHLDLALVLAMAGMHGDAIRLAEHGVRRYRFSTDAMTAVSERETLSLVYTLCRQSQRAIDELSILVSQPGTMSAELAALDPDYAGLRSHDRFQRLLTTQRSQ